MNAITPVQSPEQFAAATIAVHCWRGRCIAAFSRAEASVTECLLAMSLVADRGQTVRLPHLVGQRFEALAAAISEGASFAAEGTSAMPALAAFRQHDDVRAALCHGVADILLDRRSRWTVVLRTISLRAGHPTRTTLALSADEAERLRADIGRAAQQLCSRLDRITDDLRRS